MSDTNDLVKKLRTDAEYWREMDPERSCTFDKSADEITRLQAELDAANKQRLHNVRIINRAKLRIIQLEAELSATKDKLSESEALLAKAVDALELADNNLTNLQPKIANGLVRSDWVPVFDGYIDPVIQAARAALTQKDTVHD